MKEIPVKATYGKKHTSCTFYLNFYGGIFLDFFNKTYFGGKIIFI